MLTTFLRERYGESLDEIVIALKEKLNSQVRSTAYTDMLFKHLEYSFHRLDIIYQQCFLYCALYPKCYPIEVGQLIDYWMWEGLLDNYIESLEAKRQLGLKVLKELKDARLLEIVDSNSSTEVVKMFGLFHDMALNILCKQGGFIIYAGNNLTDFVPIEDRNEVIQRASFVHNRLRALTREPICSKLSTLLLQDNPLDWFSNDFFTGIPNLKLLDLSHTNISFLPPSLFDLKDLQVLLLRHCPGLKNLPSLSKLEKLIVLDLFGTPIEDLPPGMRKLKNLRRLDVSYTKLTVFPAGLVGALVCLQELLVLMDNAEGYTWRSSQITSGSKDAHVEELAQKGLLVLHLNFFNTKMFNNYMRAIAGTKPYPHSPRSFKFCVGGFYTNRNMGENSLAFIGDHHVDQLPGGTSELYLTMYNQSLSTLKNTGISFENLKVLDVSDYRGLSYLFSAEMLSSLHSLEKISIRQCWSMKGIIKPAGNSNLSCCLPQLQELLLVDLPLLESIHSEEQKLEWPEFQRLSVWGCEHIEKFPRILNQLGEAITSRKLKIRGKSALQFKSLQSECCSVDVIFEEADIPEDMVSFVSVKSEESTSESTSNDNQGSFFRRKRAEKTRVATIMAKGDENGNPLESPDYVARRLIATSAFIKKMQGSIGVLFTLVARSSSSQRTGATSVPVSRSGSRRFHLPFL